MDSPHESEDGRYRANKELEEGEEETRGERTQKLDDEEKYGKTETAEEKRRRLARLYLDKLRRESGVRRRRRIDLEENEDVDPSIRKKQRDLDSHDRLADKLARRGGSGGEVL